MASIYHNRSDNWEVRTRTHGFPPQTAALDGRKEVQAWAAEVEGDMARGRFVDRREAEATTLHEALESYLTGVSPRKFLRARAVQRQSAGGESARRDGPCRDQAQARLRICRRPGCARNVGQQHQDLSGFALTPVYGRGAGMGDG